MAHSASNARGGGPFSVKGCEAVEITSGEVFLLEVNGVMKRTGMEYRHLGGGRGEYHSIDDYTLCDGMRAGFFDLPAWYAKEKP